MSTTGHPYRWAAHTYTDFYSRLFDHCRYSVQRVFECGLGTNNPDYPVSKCSRMGSLERRCGLGATIFRTARSSERISTVACCSTRSDPDLLRRPTRSRSDRVHVEQDVLRISIWSSTTAFRTFEGGRCLFEHSFDKVRPGGLYVIEDVAMRTCSGPGGISWSGAYRPTT